MTEPIPDIEVYDPSFKAQARVKWPATGELIELPHVSIDYQASRRELDRHLRRAKIQHFYGHEFGKHHRKTWNGERWILPVEVSRMVPIIIFADMLRTHLGHKILIGSSFRLAAYNTQEGQSPTSKHLWATALDISSPAGVEAIRRAIEYLTSPEILPVTLARLAERMRLAGHQVDSLTDTDIIRIGFGMYESFVHIDVTLRGQPFARSKAVTRYQ